jgi:uncharacterized phiE125 gp8 family phage protein
MAPWHDGIEWRTDIIETDAAFVALDPAWVTDYVLRAATGGAEYGLIDHYIRAATALGERTMGQHITPKTMTLTASAFPSAYFEIPDGPVREIVSVGYYDGDDLVAYDDVSPHTWIFEPGGRSRRARLSPDGSWPTAATRKDAVVVTFTVGYESADDIPADIKQAIAVTVGEFYKSPDLSNADGSEANVLTLDRFWPKRWSNAL